MIQHRLKFHIAKDISEDPGVVETKIVPIRERLLRFLLGTRRQVTLVVCPTDRHHRNRGRPHGTGSCRRCYPERW